MHLSLALRRRWVQLGMGVAMLGIAVGCGGGGGSTGGNGGGGGGGNNSNLELIGDNAEVAVGVTDAKGMITGSGVAFAILQQLTPAAPALGAAQPRIVSKPWTTSPIPGLGLNVSTTVAGAVVTFTYTTTAGAAAGKITATGSNLVGGNYTSFHVIGDITAGTIPLHADFQINFTGTKGANTMVGDLNLTKDKIDLNMNLSLDDSGNVGKSGSLTISLNYPLQGLAIPVRTTVTNLSGGPLTKIIGDATVAATFSDPKTPTVGTGSATIDLVNGTFNLTVSKGDLSGLVALANNGNETLTVTTSDGLNKVLPQIGSFNLSTLLSSVTTSHKAYAAPVLISGTGDVRVEQALGNGEMVGFSRDSSLNPTALYWSSPTAAPITLNAPTGGSHTSAHGISSTTGQEVIVGSYVNASGVTQPCFWIKTSTSGQFNPTTGVNLQSGGEFLGISGNGNYIVGYQYGANFVQKPLAFIAGTSYPLLTDGRTGNLRATGVDNNGDVLGLGDSPSVVPGVWTKISVDQGSNSITTPFVALVNEGIQSQSLTAFHISPTGTIVGGAGNQAIYWRSADSFGPNNLALGGTFGMAYGVSDDSTKIAGTVQPSNSTQDFDLGYWPALTSFPIDVETEIDSVTGMKDLAGFFVLNDGSMVCLAQNTSTSKTEFVYVKKR